MWRHVRSIEEGIRIILRNLLSGEDETKQPRLGNSPKPSEDEAEKPLRNGLRARFAQIGAARRGRG
jgi:hypothetical protein